MTYTQKDIDYLLKALHQSIIETPMKKKNGELDEWNMGKREGMRDARTLITSVIVHRMEEEKIDDTNS
jgi:hypothetical protein